MFKSTHLFSSPLHCQRSGHTDIVWDVSWAPSSEIVASCSGDTLVKIWSVESGAEMASFKAHDMYVRRLSWAPNGRSLATCSGDKTIRVWKLLPGGKPVVLSGNTGTVGRIQCSPDGKKVCSGSWKGDLKIWDCTTATTLPLLTLKGKHDGPALVARWSPDGEKLCTSSFWGTDSTIKIWDTKNGNLLTTLTDHDKSVGAVDWSPDGSMIVSSSDDNTIKIWDTNNFVVLATLSGHTDRVRAVSWSPDSTWLASGSFDKTVRLWDVKPRVDAGSVGDGDYTLEGHSREVLHVSWSPAGDHIASCSTDCVIRIWSSKTRTTVCELKGHTARVNEACWSKDCNMLITCSQDSTVRLWDIANASLLRTFNSPVPTHPNFGVGSVALSATANTLCFAAGDNIVLWPDVDAVFWSQAVLPSWALNAAAMVDEYHDDDEQQFKAVAMAIEATLVGPAWTTFAAADFFEDLARKGSTVGLNRCLYRQQGIPRASISPARLLRAALESNQAECIDAVLQHVSEGVINANFVAARKAKPLHTHNMHMADGGAFYAELLAIASAPHFRHLALEFLLNCPMLTSPVEVGADLKGRGPAKMSVQLARSSNEERLWKTPTNTRQKTWDSEVDVVCSPFPGLAGTGSESALHKLLRDIEDPASFFGSTVATAMVEDKWDRYGWIAHLCDLFLHFLGLAAMMMWQLTDGTVSETGVVATVVIHGALSRDSVLRKLLALRTGFAQRNRAVAEVAQLALVIAAVSLYKLQHEHFVGILAVSIYLKWMSTLFYLQPYHSTGALVRMVVEIIREMQPFLMLLCVGILAVSYKCWSSVANSSSRIYTR